MNAPVVIPDASDLSSTIERARHLLDDGDLVAARILAAKAYDDARQGVALAERFGAARGLVEKARRLQGEALLIEARAKVAIAEHVDAAQEAGELAKGRPKTLPEGKTFTVEDVGLDHKQIHEARRLRDAVAREPGIVERAIAARLEHGLSPTKASLRAAIGTSSATKEERGLDLYETPGCATQALLSLESFGPEIWEPSCGRGAISTLLEAAGYRVYLSDIEDRGCHDRDGALQEVIDFLETSRDRRPCEHEVDIVTNPPFGISNRYIRYALEVHRPRKMALLLNLNWLCGADDQDRNWVWQNAPPARVHVFARRLPMMHRDGWDGKKSGSQMNTAWFVWERDALTGEYCRPTIVDRVDWKELDDAAPLDPGADLERPESPMRSPAELPEAIYAEAVQRVQGHHRAAGPSWLSRVMGLTRSQASAALDRMEAEGVITARDAVGQRWPVITSERDWND